MATVVLLGTLDTKGSEYAYLRDVVIRSGCEVIMVDGGITADPDYPVDYSRRDVASAAGADIDALVAAGDRGAAVTTMAEGSAVIIDQLCAEGRLDGILGAGGSGGSSIISNAMRRLPVGVPKMLVSTMASGDIKPYVDTSDISITYSVVDIAGINTVSAEVLSNAAVGISAMAAAYAARDRRPSGKPLVGATMYGTTTACVGAAREHLEQCGYEVLVFHATGAGGRAMERLMHDGHITASLDITTSEIIDEVAGGLLTAGAERLDAAGALGIPQVVSVGGADQITFRSPDTVPERFAGRTSYVHNSSITLIRSNAEECAEFGRVVGEKLNRSLGPVSLFLPLRGTSSYAVEGGVFHDPVADAALFTSLTEVLDESVEVVEMDTDINDPAFGEAMARRLDELYSLWVEMNEAESGDTDQDTYNRALVAVDAVQRGTRATSIEPVKGA